MADNDLQLPEGATIIPNPNDQMPPPVSGQPGATLVAPPGAAVQPQVSGNFLPASRNAQGSLNFDPNAGFLGDIWRAIKLPGQILSGEVPTPYTLPKGAPSDYSQYQGTPNPAAVYNDPGLLARANTAATLASPQSVASRAGELIPGELSRYAVPSASQLKSVADAGFDAARANSGLVPAPMMQAVGEGLSQRLQQMSRIPENSPKTFEALTPFGAKDADYTLLDAYRRRLQDISMGKDGATPTDQGAASIAINHFDQLIDTVAPEAATARANLAAAKRSNTISGALDQATTGMQEQAEGAAASANSGMNLDNAIRQKVKTFLQSPENLRGYSPEEVAALEGVRDGNLPINALRTFGNMFGGGGGLGRSLSAAAGWGLGRATGIEGASELGMFAMPTLGAGLKNAENSLAAARLQAVDELVRSRSPLGQQWRAGGALVPSTNWNSLLKNTVTPTVESGAPLGNPPPGWSPWLPPQPQPPAALPRVTRGLLDSWA